MDGAGGDDTGDGDFPTARRLELDVTDLSLLEPLLVGGLDLTDGTVGVPTEPGLGVEIPDEVVAEYGAG